jgi:protein TonB
MDAMQEQQTQLLAQMRKQLAACPSPTRASPATAEQAARRKKSAASC